MTNHELENICVGKSCHHECHFNTLPLLKTTNVFNSTSDMSEERFTVEKRYLLILVFGVLKGIRSTYIIQFVLNILNIYLVRNLVFKK